MLSKRQRNERLVAVAVVGFLALNFPLLELFNRAALVLGVPLLFIYLFVAWAVLIGAVAAVLEGKGSNGSSHRPPSTSD